MARFWNCFRIWSYGFHDDVGSNGCHDDDFDVVRAIAGALTT